MSTLVAALHASWHNGHERVSECIPEGTSTLLYLALHFCLQSCSHKKTGNDTYVKTNNNKDIKVDSSCMEAKKTARLSS